jgi:hypothetical protein
MERDIKIETEGVTYTILRINGNRAIRCDREVKDTASTEKRVCGFLSYSLNDIAQRYCGRCHVFHDDVTPDAWHTENAGRP